MLREIKTVHVANAVTAKGGWVQMEQSDWGRWAAHRVQYDYANKFASEIRYGKQKLMGDSCNARTCMDQRT